MRGGVSGAVLVAIALIVGVAPASAAVKGPPLQTPITITGAANVGDPGVGVDTDGTAYIAWNVDVDSASDQAGFCRLPRGATACASTQTFTFADSAEAFSSVRVLVPEPKHVIIDLYRCCNEHNEVIESVDGGVTFSAPVDVGVITSDHASIGPGPDAVQTIGDSLGGATYQAMPTKGPKQTTAAQLGSANNPQSWYGGGTGLVDSTTPIAAFSDLKDTYFRVFDPTKGPDYNSSVNWKPAQMIAGENEPELTSGSGGTFLLTLATPPKGFRVLNVRRFNAGLGSFGAPTTITQPGSPIFQDLFADQGGGATVAYVDNRDDNALYYAQSVDGLAWADPVKLTGADAGYGIQVATAPDHGGFAISDNNGNGPIRAVPIPTAAQAQQLQGSGGNTKDCTNTLQVTPTVVAATKGGCFKKSGTTYTATGDVRVNGIDFITGGAAGRGAAAHAAAAGTVTVDTATNTVKAGSGVDEKIGAVVLNKGALSWDLDKPTKFTGLDKFDIKLFGFPLVGEATANFDKGGVTVDANLVLPAPFKAVTGDVHLKGTQLSGLKLDGLHIAVKKAEVGALGVRDLDVVFSGGLTTFEGHAKFLLPPNGDESSVLTVGFGFSDGKFQHAEIPFYSGPPLPILLYPPAVTLDSVGFGVSVVNGFRLDGSVGISAAKILKIDGKFFFALPADKDYAELGVNGKLSLFDLPLASANAYFNTDGLFTFGGQFAIGNSTVGVNGSVKGGLNIPKGDFYATGDANVCVLACAGASAIVSSIGIAACADISLVSVGAGYKFGDGTHIYLKGCDVDDYKPAGLRSLRQVGSSGAITLKAGMPEAGIRVTGNGGLPAISVTGPDGKAISSAPADPAAPANAPGYLLVPDPATNTVQVLIGKPAAGAYKVTSVGGAPIAKVESADGLADTTATGSLSGTGRTRKLSYSVANLGGGRTVTFAERSAAGLTHAIGTARAAKGTLPVSLLDGPGGARSIVAVVTGSDGLALSQSTVATYTAPGPVTPARVPSLKVRRSGSRATISWGKAAGAKSYLLAVRLTDGRMLQFTQARRSYVVASVERTDRIVVSVRGVSALGHRGRAAAKTLRPGKSRA